MLSNIIVGDQANFYLEGGLIDDATFTLLVNLLLNPLL